MRCPFTLPPPSTLSHVTSCTCGCDRVFTCFFFFLVAEAVAAQLQLLLKQEGTSTRSE